MARHIQSRFVVGEPIQMEYTKRNVSGENLVVWHRGFWPNHQVFVRDLAGREPPLTAEGRRCRKAFGPDGPRDKSAPKTLTPDAEDRNEANPDLTTLYDLSKPGTYAVEYVYEEKHAQGWQGRVTSKPFVFEVVPRN
jgi:hypothetical protein